MSILPRFGTGEPNFGDSRAWLHLKTKDLFFPIPANIEHLEEHIMHRIRSRVLIENILRILLDNSFKPKWTALYAPPREEYPKYSFYDYGLV